MLDTPVTHYKIHMNKKHQTFWSKLLENIELTRYNNTGMRIKVQRSKGRDGFTGQLGYSGIDLDMGEPGGPLPESEEGISEIWV